MIFFILSAEFANRILLHMRLRTIRDASESVRCTYGVRAATYAAGPTQRGGHAACMRGLDTRLVTRYALPLRVVRCRSTIGSSGHARLHEQTAGVRASAQPAPCRLTRPPATC